MPENPHPTRLLDVGRIARLEADVGELKEDMALVKEAIVEHRLRLENGTKVFSDLRGDIADKSGKIAALQPKPPSISKVVSLTLALVMAGGGVIWLMATMLHERPTHEQVYQSMDSSHEAHEAAGHRELREDVEDIKTLQAVQQKLIENVGKQQAQDSSKLDKILRQTTPRR